jgi:S-(hydroxymethyl)glutathione dehydrogenase/alcohol dehydrogenase
VIRAAQLPSPGATLELVDVQEPQPRAGEVAVRLVASALCPLDLEWENSDETNFPAVPGHEGTGRVVTVGAGVADVKPGDPVVLTRTASCGWCYWCSRGEGALCEQSAASGGASGRGWTFGALAGVVVVPQSALVRLHPSVDLLRAGRVGCGLLTGVAAVRRARIRSGESVVVLGCDGVGLHLIQSARVVGAHDVIAIDASPQNRAAAQRLGAVETHAPDAAGVAAVLDRTLGRGADVVIVTPSGRSDWGEAAAYARRGGRLLVVDGPASQHLGQTDAVSTVVTKSLSLTGFNYGSSHPREDITLLLELVASGALELGHDLTVVLRFEEAALGMALLREGTVTQVVLEHDAD